MNASSSLLGSLLAALRGLFFDLVAGWILLASTFGILLVTWIALAVRWAATS